MTEPFSVQFSFKGRIVTSEATASTTAGELVADARRRLDLPDDGTKTVKILYRGKRFHDQDDDSANNTVFASKVPKTVPKLMVLVTERDAVQALNAKRSDPTIRSLDQEIHREQQKNHEEVDGYWGPGRTQDREYKFCRFEACTWQSFGHRPVDSTPHDFAAMALLERLATDPGVVAVMRTRQLVVGTLGEMDPIDDRLMRQKQKEGGCLLGYNTNGGQRIDVKLRTDDLKAFRPYQDLVATLIHELSHNWVGEHNLLFWTNYAQMRSEYLFTHARVTSGVLVRGKTTAQLAGLSAAHLRSAQDVYQYVMTRELLPDMAQHNLHPDLLAQGFQQHCSELERKVRATLSQANTLGGDGIPSSTSATIAIAGNPRALVLAAAERRARQQGQQRREDDKDQKTKPSDEA